MNGFARVLILLLPVIVGGVGLGLIVIGVKVVWNSDLLGFVWIIAGLLFILLANKMVGGGGEGHGGH